MAGGWGAWPWWLCAACMQWLLSLLCWAIQALRACSPTPTPPELPLPPVDEKDVVSHRGLDCRGRPVTLLVRACLGARQDVLPTRSSHPHVCTRPHHNSNVITAVPVIGRECQGTSERWRWKYPGVGKWRRRRIPLGCLKTYHRRWNPHLPDPLLPCFCLQGRQSARQEVPACSKGSRGWRCCWQVTRQAAHAAGSPANAGLL